MPTPVADVPAFVGQDRLRRYLFAALKKDRLPRALLFVGPAALGKARGALWLVQADLCADPHQQPCLRCVTCRRLQRHEHPSVTWIDPPSGESVSIDTMRDTLHQYALRSWDADRHWLVIIDADRLTESAQATMLKFLEELPPRVQVIMTTSAVDRLPATMLSRLTIFTWYLVSAANLRKTFPTATREAVARAAGRPGWLSQTTMVNSVDRETIADMPGRLERLLDGRAGDSSPTRLLVAAANNQLAQEELLVREVLLVAMGAHQRLLWPHLTSAWESLSQRTTLATLRAWAEQYLDRYELTANIHHRLLYDDVHMV